jgi:hypothetical protein
VAFSFATHSVLFMFDALRCGYDLWPRTLASARGGSCASVYTWRNLTAWGVASKEFVDGFGRAKIRRK